MCLVLFHSPCLLAACQMNHHSTEGILLFCYPAAYSLFLLKLYRNTINLCNEIKPDLIPVLFFRHFVH
jgi:hypothetical protein